MPGNPEECEYLYLLINCLSYIDDDIFVLEASDLSSQCPEGKCRATANSSVNCFEFYILVIKALFCAILITTDQAVADLGGLVKPLKLKHDNLAPECRDPIFLDNFKTLISGECSWTPPTGDHLQQFVSQSPFSKILLSATVKPSSL